MGLQPVKYIRTCTVQPILCNAYRTYRIYRISMPAHCTYTSTPTMGYRARTDFQRLYSEVKHLLLVVPYGPHRPSVPVKYN